MSVKTKSPSVIEPTFNAKSVKFLFIALIF